MCFALRRCSEPDPARPGLQGDIKYFCRKSRPAENCMPPRASGWLKVGSLSRLNCCCKYAVCCTAHVDPLDPHEYAPFYSTLSGCITAATSTKLLTLSCGLVWFGEGMRRLMRLNFFFNCSYSRALCLCVSLQRDAGSGQPPTVTPLVSEGYLCPPGQEYDSLEWELAKWLTDNKVPVCYLTH